MSAWNGWGLTLSRYQYVPLSNEIRFWKWSEECVRQERARWLINMVKGAGLLKTESGSERNQKSPTSWFCRVVPLERRGSHSAIFGEWCSSFCLIWPWSLTQVLGALCNWGRHKTVEGSYQADSERSSVWSHHHSPSVSTWTFLTSDCSLCSVGKGNTCSADLTRLLYQWIDLWNQKVRAGLSSRNIYSNMANWFHLTSSLQPRGGGCHRQCSKASAGCSMHSAVID